MEGLNLAISRMNVSPSSGFHAHLSNVAPSPSQSDGLGEPLYRDPRQLGVELERSDPRPRTRHLEVHVAEAVLHALDV